jgi:hypothetical protein
VTPCEDCTVDLFTEIDRDPPAVRGSETSREAAEEIRPHLNRLEAVVLDAVRASGMDGLTDEEGIDATRLSPSTYRPRRVRMVELGRVVDSGRKRATASGRLAVVWVTRDVLSQL